MKFQLGTPFSEDSAPHASVGSRELQVLPEESAEAGYFVVEADPALGELFGWAKYASPDPKKGKRGK